MSEDNIEIIRRLMRRRTVATLPALMSTSTRRLSFTPRFDVEEIIDAGDRVVVLSTQHAVPKGGHQQMSARVIEVWTIRDGLFAERRSYSTREEALEAAGLSDGELSSGK